MLLRRPQSELCTRSNGFLEDLVCAASAATLVDRIYAESRTHRRCAPPISNFADRSNLRNDSAPGSERARSPSFCPTDQSDRMIRNSRGSQETNDHRRADFGRKKIDSSKFRHPDQLRDTINLSGNGGALTARRRTDLGCDRAIPRGRAARLGLDGGLRVPRSIPAWRRSS